jgi:hypothetical protein
MTAEVNPTTFTGTSRLRSYRIELFNPSEGALSALFHQEQLLTLDDGTTISRPAPDIRIPYDPDAVVHIIDPVTGANTGQTMTQAQIYAGVFSAYFAAANAPAEGA